VIHAAVGDRQRSAVVYAAALAARRTDVAKPGDVVAYNAVQQRQRRAAAIIGIVVDAAPSIISIIAGDNAVEDRQYGVII
jgi:hypothetical protein